ncbi:hypothetical protein EVAR_40230_1 [Eumeta japonica]|uniref:Uncharacterized protein n=1 Tax=Eumeta variegata TaxID=151549 RepID=A0A4C1X7S1_EUMVA|nr:hypothetical protein EVAR_40230_1 [Eumeta japonica]
MVFIQEVHKRPVDLSSNTEKCYTYEEALDLAGTGRYNLWLLYVTSVVIIAMGLDMFGFSVVVAGCTCDFELTLTQKGILTSMPLPAITIACLIAIQRLHYELKCIVVEVLPTTAGIKNVLQRVDVPRMIRRVAEPV